MKVYVHVEENSPCAVICHVEGKQRVEILLNQFIERYAEKTGTKLDVDALELRGKHGKEIPKDKRIGSLIEHMDDVFVNRPGEKKQPVKKTPVPVAPSLPSTSTIPLPEKVQNKPKPVNPNNPVFNELMALGKREEANESYRKASGYYKQIVDACPDHKQALIQLMKLWTLVGRPRVAEKWCDSCLGRYSDDLSVLMAAGALKQVMGENEFAIRLFNRAVTEAKKKPHEKFSVQDVEICAANAMYKEKGHWENTAVTLVMQVVEPEKKHFEGLLLYAKIAYDRGLVEDALQVLLRLIMQKQEHEKVKRYLADCLEKPWMLPVVIRELKTGPGIASAYAFLAARIKDYGAIEAAVHLYKNAVIQAPDDPSIALNYIHILELMLENDTAMEFAQRFLMTSKMSLIQSLECKDIGRILDGLPSHRDGGPFGWLSTEGWLSHPPCELIEDIVETVEFRDVQLDLLATLFTIVKVLYIGGALERAKKAVELIKPCCKASKKMLHETTVRNEAAYFNCIRQILEEFPPPSSEDIQGLKSLYLCGDSHCLSGAWQRVQLYGEEHVLVPKLVTGCKVWHLRTDSRFYPKHGFEKTMGSLPKNSTIILNFGEIDCRTGIGLAVEKCKYDSQAAAVKKTIAIYVQVIKNLVKEYGFKIYVHPVPPALDVTRPIVMAYNKVLQASIKNVSEMKDFKNKVYWLEFVDGLLTPDGEHLKPELSFDDTHLAPGYTAYLKKALVDCEPAEL